jgi:hypothetical protein
MSNYKAGSKGRCPHCLTTVQFLNGKSNFMGGKFNEVSIFDQDDSKNQIDIYVSTCPQCSKSIIAAEIGRSIWDTQSNKNNFEIDMEFIVWPRQITRAIPKEVPKHIVENYNEAASVLSISPKASAALSRRCLQALLREAGDANQKNLVDQIEYVKPQLPIYIAENIDSVRNIGNFAAHPTKNTDSCEIVDVEPGEAEWNLDVLDLLFDIYYVQPVKAKEKRESLNSKLLRAGKPPMK